MSSSSQEEEEENDFEEYYAFPPETDHEAEAGSCANSRDPEYFEYTCLERADVERLLNESVETVSAALHVTPSLAKKLLHAHQWNIDDVVSRFRINSDRTLVEARIKPSSSSLTRLSSSPNTSSNTFEGLRKRPKIPIFSNLMGTNCAICFWDNLSTDRMCKVSSCGHVFCAECWQRHFEIQILQGISTGIECMAQQCNVVVPEDFVLGLLNKTHLREKYQQFAFNDYVKSHHELRFCPGAGCSIVIQAKERKAKRVICKHCKSQFCFACAGVYHAPADCDTIRKWMTKCADDSETANYISAHTKDCPKCHICIEKNGGCNHMQCYGCKYDFCWMCLGDWKTHGSQYYECSRYKENPNIASESAHAQAREALKKYLFYFERWENHAKSLRLEERTEQTIRERTHQQVMSGHGTWIDWQYLMDAATLLARCRYTLQYTYPYAYYLESGPRKELFEYQQAQLEAEIENLSWKVERAETTDRGDLENQMDIAEKRRTNLLKDFLD